MLKLIAYRLLLAVPQLLAILVLSFLLTYLVPGSPAQALLRFGATPERIAEVEAELGLDSPIHERLAGYIGDAVQGDLGESYLSKRPVTDLIVERLPATLSMVIGGVTVSLILGMGMGILAGTRLDRPADRAVMAGTSIAVSVPQFLLGLFLLLLVSIELEWIPVVAYVRFTEDPLLWARGMLLPSLALGFAASGLIARQMRAGMAAAVHSDFGASLAAAGVSRRRFYFRYGIKNAMVPVLAATGLTLAILVGASFAVERVFSIPGVGHTLLHAVTSKDFPVVQGAVVVIAVLVIVLNILIDIGYALINPRIRVQ